MNEPTGHAYSWCAHPKKRIAHAFKLGVTSSLCGLAHRGRWTRGSVEKNRCSHCCAALERQRETGANR